MGNWYFTLMSYNSIYNHCRGPPSNPPPPPAVLFLFSESFPVASVFFGYISCGKAASSYQLPTHVLPFIGGVTPFIYN